MCQPVPPDDGGVVRLDDGEARRPDGDADPRGVGVVPSGDGVVEMAPRPLAGSTPTPTLLFAALQLTPAA